MVQSLNKCSQKFNEYALRATLNLKIFLNFFYPCVLIINSNLIRVSVIRGMYLMIFDHRLFVFLIIFVTSRVSAQVDYDPNLKRAYDSVFTKLDSRLIKLVNNPENRIRGVALVTYFKLDTLNRADLLPPTTGEITTSPAAFIPEKILTPDVMIGRAEVRGDSLTVTVKPWFMQGERIIHRISNNLLSSSYELWNREDRLFKVASYQQEEDDGHPRVNVKARITLSDTKFVPGKTLYGAVDMQSDEYSEIHSGGFKNGVKKLRVEYKYLFKFIIQKDEGVD